VASVDVLSTLAEAFARSLGVTIEGNAKVAGIFSEFVAKMGELSIKEAARKMGQRSASTRQRGEKGKFLSKRKASGCLLCDDPTTRNVTVAMVNAHRSHEAGQPAEIKESPSDSQDDGPSVPKELLN